MKAIVLLLAVTIVLLLFCPLAPAGQIIEDGDLVFTPTNDTIAQNIIYRIKKMCKRPNSAKVEQFVNSVISERNSSTGSWFFHCEMGRQPDGPRQGYPSHVGVIKVITRGKDSWMFIGKYYPSLK